jgi:hypothetical protein
MDDKLLYSLVALALGWLLAQGTEWVKVRSRRRTITNGLLDELRDIDQLMVQALLAHQRELQFAVQGALEPRSAAPIGAVLFEQSFGEAAPLLGQSQRLSFATIHNLRVGYNKLLEERRDLVMEAQETVLKSEQTRLQELVARGDQMSEALYRSALEIRWHVRFHLDHPEVPHLDLFGSVHRSYLEFQRDLDRDIEETRLQAKTLSREAMTAPFDERAFNEMAKSFHRSR